MSIKRNSSAQLSTWIALVEFEACHPDSPLDFSKPGGFSNVVGLASSKSEFIGAITAKFKELQSNILDVDDVEILDLRDNLNDFDQDIIASISSLSIDSRVEIATIDYYLERPHH